MTRLRLLASFGIFLLTGLMQSSAIEIKERTPAQLLPPATMAYAEVSHPKQLVDLVLDHPLRRKLEEHEEYRKATSTPQFFQFKLVVSFLEQQIGLAWPAALEAVSGEGLTAAFDAETRSTAVLAKSADPNALARAVQTVVRLARDDARNKGNADPFRESEYRNVTVYAGGDGRFAVCGPWLFVTGGEGLMRRVLDNYFDDNATSLAQNEQFRQARDRRQADPTGWLYLDLKQVRKFDPSNKLLRGKADDPAGELLLGGPLEALKDAPYVTLSLSAARDRLSLAADIPFAAGKVSPAREYYFGAAGKGAAPAAVAPRNMLANVVTFRDFARFWASAPELFDDPTQAKFEQADSQISPLFSGRDFARDILGAIKGEVQLVATRQQFEGTDLPAPELKLPAFALVMRLKDPQKLSRPLKASFQSIVGFANVAGAQNGQPQLELESTKQGDAEFVTSTYVAPDDAAQQKVGKVNYNFSPSIALVGDRFILSSTAPLAKELAELVRQPGAASSNSKSAEKSTTNTHVEANTAVLDQVLGDNRQQLIAHNMLEKGHARAAAEREISLLIELLTLLRGASLDLSTQADTLRLELSAGLATAP